jgi:DNA excision repair protein ERCC-4
MGDKKVQIAVDDRERPSGVVEELEKRIDVSVTVERLATGDYCVDGTVLFERKSATDFARSLIEGRLFGQASRMAQTDFRPAFLIEGSAADWMRVGTGRETIQGALITLALFFDIPVFRSFDPIESAHLILYAGRQLTRLRDPNYWVYHKGKSNRRKTRQLRVLQSLPGVGADRALRLLEHFHSVRACFVASVDELREVDGIGLRTAKSICDLLDCRWPLDATITEERSRRCAPVNVPGYKNVWNAH